MGIYTLNTLDMKKQVVLNFTIDEAKIIFDALSSHRYKISNKKDAISEEFATQNIDQEAVQEFMNQRISAIESEIEKTDEIFKKIGEFVKSE
jgi:flagellar motor component MotA